MQYTIPERVFIVRTYWVTGSVIQCQREYLKKFGGRKPPTRNTILNLAKKLETTGSLVDSHTGGRPPMSEKIVEDLKDRLQRCPEKSLRNLSKETGYSYSTCQRAVKIGKLKPYCVTARQKLKKKNRKVVKNKEESTG